MDNGPVIPRIPPATFCKLLKFFGTTFQSCTAFFNSIPFFHCIFHKKFRKLEPFFPVASHAFREFLPDFACFSTNFAKLIKNFHHVFLYLPLMVFFYIYYLHKIDFMQVI